MQRTAFRAPRARRSPRGGSFGGLDLFVSAVTLNGITFTNVNGLGSPSAVSVTFAGGPVFAPPFTADSVVLTSPFTLNGLFSLAPDLQTSPNQGTFVGSGIASLTLLRVSNDNLWEFGGVRYDFATAPTAVTPEPGSLLLLGTGLIGAAGALRRRRNARRSSATCARDRSRRS